MTQFNTVTEHGPGHTEPSPSRDIPPNLYRNRGPNVGENERLASGLIGSALLVWAIRREGLCRALAMAGGLALLGRAATGRCLLKRSLQPDPYARQVAQDQGWTAATVTSAAVTIARPRPEVYALWRDFSNLPHFMEHVQNIEVMTPHRSRWEVRAPLGKTVSWTSYVTGDVENEHIAWEAESGAEVPNFGWVEFRDAPGGRGTEVRALIAYQPPLGEAGRLLNTLFRETPAHQMRDDLRRLKQMMETGEVAVTGT